MRILALGGTGTLSTSIVKLSKEKGYEVAVFNRGNHKILSGVKLIKGDFTQKQDLLMLRKEKFDVIIDFLSRTAHDINRVYSILGNSCSQYIFISSSCVYRRNCEDFPIKETSPKPNTLWNYNVQKYESEQELVKLSQGFSSTYTIVRPYITYDKKRIPLGITPSYDYHKTLIERFRHNKPWFIWDDGKAITTVTYVEEFAIGVVGLFFNPKAINEDFHIVGDYKYSQTELVEQIKQKLNSNSPVVYLSSDKICESLPEYSSMLIGDRALDAIFDNSKIKEAVPELTFRTDLNKGLDIIIANWDSTESSKIDYSFEARIDKMLSKYCASCEFIDYGDTSSLKKITYMLFKYLNLRLAGKLYGVLNKFLNK